MYIEFNGFQMLTKYKIVPFCPYHFVHTILSNAILSVYHFVHTILSVPFCLLPFCPVTVLRSHGLQPQMLHEVAKMTTIASLMYASPAWLGYSSANDRARIDLLLRKLKRSGFLPQAAPDAEALAREADDRLFKSILLDPKHVWRKNFPKTRPTNYNLRPRAHEFKLPLKDDRNFVPSLLFKDMY